MTVPTFSLRMDQNRTVAYKLTHYITSGLEIVTFLHLFREVINEATMKCIQFLTSVSPGGKVMKKNSKGWFIFRSCLQGYNTLHLSV